jgi:hypothetical protein
MGRTWSLLSAPLYAGDSFIVRNDPICMGWKVGDRIAIAPTDDLSQGEAQSITVAELHNEVRVTLVKSSSTFHAAINIFGPAGAAYQSAEVIN